jgi:DNA helicase-2/ATP-dependent DNA helicase PcrA
MATVYALYEMKLRSENVLDYNGLILEACRLLAANHAVAARIRKCYLYWLIDEFQDTTRGQYLLLRYMAGGQFANVFAVADDDQIIYQWNGASYRQLEKFRADYRPDLIQLVENHRCPPEVVAIANRLVAHNTQRTPDKRETVAARLSPVNVIETRVFATAKEESKTLASEIFAQGSEGWKKIAILGRRRALLEPMLSSLRELGVPAAILERRDSFISPQFVWLEMLLDQALRPRDKRRFAVFVNAANRFAAIELDPLIIMAQAQALGLSYLEQWGAAASSYVDTVANAIGKLTLNLTSSRAGWKVVVKDAIKVLMTATHEDGVAEEDVSEDHEAWKMCLREIRAESGREPGILEIVQGLALRSKEPPATPDTVALLTIHASKGLEFDHVYVIGLAENEMPSHQSVKKGDTSPEMEEERRNCFVAITRTRERLVLSRAGTYGGYSRKPSRFLGEMGLLGGKPREERWRNPMLSVPL